MKKIMVFLLLAAILVTLSLPAYAVTYPVRSSEKADALYFETQPVFDGVINELEWGLPTVHVIDDGSVPSSFSMRVGDTGLLADPSATPDHYFDLWLRWDEKYFYVALRTNDSKPYHSYADGSKSGDFWNGDVCQFVVDPNGNWEMQGKEKHAGWGEGYAFHLYAMGNDGKPYAFAYTYTDYSEILLGISNDGAFTSYEIGLPWHIIHTDTAQFKTGKVVGFAMSLLFSNDASDYYGWMTWGDETCYNQLNESRVGSNAITLSSAPAVVIPEVIEEEVVEEAVVIPPTTGNITVPQTSDNIVILVMIIALATLIGVRIKRRSY
ncbi:MAG: hypothetical protein FWF15_04645 [Oscillospiraceae bacterium]|nr:hypothetical protein [Oscillospiraceae bacterium]